jgi:hypothetical protein
MAVNEATAFPTANNRDGLPADVLMSGTRLGWCGCFRHRREQEATPTIRHRSVVEGKADASALYREIP